MSDFFDDLLRNLVDDALHQVLPRGTRFLSYNQETFTFVQRRDSGNTVLHEAKARPLDLGHLLRWSSATRILQGLARTACSHLHSGRLHLDQRRQHPRPL